MLDRINAPSSCKCLSSKVSIAEKVAWAMQKLFIEKGEKLKKVLRKKWTSVQDIENNGYLDAWQKKDRKKER